MSREGHHHPEGEVRLHGLVGPVTEGLQPSVSEVSQHACLLRVQRLPSFSFPFSGRCSYCPRVRAESRSVATPPPPQVNLASSSPALPPLLGSPGQSFTPPSHPLLLWDQRSLHSSLPSALPPERSPVLPDSQELMQLQGFVGDYSIQANLACGSSTEAFWGQILSSPTKHYMNTGLNISSLTSKQLTHHA